MKIDIEKLFRNPESTCPYCNSKLKSKGYSGRNLGPDYWEKIEFKCGYSILWYEFSNRKIIKRCKNDRL